VIWLLRHGEAEEGSPDAERRLTDRGAGQARAAGRALAGLGIGVGACLSSPRLRAVDTAKLACEALGVDVVIEQALAGGPFDPLEVTAGLQDVLLVGHEPDFSQAVHGLTGARIDLKKGGLAGVEGGELRVLLRPSELDAIAE
jgi:phosphohistidine phosphatase